MPQAPDADEIVERLPDPVMVVAAGALNDPSDRTITFANTAAQTLLRIPAEGAPLVSVLRHPRLLEAVDQGLSDGGAEADYETYGAQPRWWRALVRPLPNTSSGIRQVLLILRDETDARRNERMRADFLANASHELRTPLASLTGFVETLQGHAKDDPVARDRFLGIMAAQAGRMARLIDDLLSLSRIELNEHIPPSGEVDLKSAIHDVMSASGPMHAQRGVRIVPTIPSPPPLIQGDRDQVVQVLQNLIDNAAKYSPDGGEVRVEVVLAPAGAAATPSRPGAARLSLLTPDAADGRYAVIRVSDDGPGIARQNLPRLSERFYRVEGQKSGERLGTGLGLAIVKHIVNRHRGGLVVESAEGQGTTFTAYFPVTH